MSHLSRSDIAQYMSRGLTLIVGLGSIAWACSAIPLFWNEKVFIRAANQIAAGETFRRDALSDLNAQIEHGSESSFRSIALSKIAIVQLRATEDVLAGSVGQAIDRNFSLLSTTITAALTNAPADAFLWLALFWLENGRNGFAAEHLRSLETSYSIGPHEGWIALKRTRIALNIFPALRGGLSDKAMSEFVNLLGSGFFEDAADIFAGQGRDIQAAILDRLKDVNEATRREFARELSKRGIDSIPIPGERSIEKRPWVRG